jgi:transposase InsO family protein
MVFVLSKLTMKGITVNNYKHARTTYYNRVLIVERYQSGWTQQAIADSFGISRRTVCKWLQRWREAGACGLHNRTSRPKRSPHKLAKVCENAIVQLRRTFLMPAYGIAAYLGLAYSTVCRTLKKHGINRKRDIFPPAKPHRYERKSPGELIHIDIKKLAKINGVGHRIHGDRTQGKGKGWEYLHVAIDDHSRLAYCEILPDETSATSIGFARNAKQWFKQHNITIQRIMTDNGVGYKNRYKCMLKAWGIKHITTRPYTPKTNGKAERFIRTCLEEWAYLQPYQNSNQRTQNLKPFIDFYNTQRYHHAIKQTPIKRCEQPIEM